MKKVQMKKVILGLFAVCFCVMVCKMPVKASMYTLLNPGTFDYVAYADRYPDLKAVYGYDPNLLYSHYINNGIYENRIGTLSRWAFLNPATFNADAYREDYPELAHKYGANNLALFQHYQTTGVKEGRKVHAVIPEAEAMMGIMDTAREITKNCTTDRQKIQAVHDWMCVNLDFNYVNWMNNSVQPWAYTYTGAWNTKEAVGQGYAEMFDAFMWSLGIPDRVIIGQGYYATGWGPHAWNQVKVDGKWLCMDVCWDDPFTVKPGVVQSYQYFLIPTQQMLVNHKG